MRLGERERKVIFGTPVVSYQLQKFLKNLPGYTCSVTDIEKFFFDLSKGRVYSTISSLKSKGILKLEGDMVTLLEYKVRGNDSDKIWRAVRIQKTFTAKTIAQLTNLPYDRVKWVLRDLANQGAIEKVNESKGNHKTVYTLLNDQITRPKQNNAKPKKCDIAWWLIRKSKEEGITLDDLYKNMIKKNADMRRNDLKKQLNRWVEDQAIAIVGEDQRYVAITNVRPILW